MPAGNTRAVQILSILGLILLVVLFPGLTRLGVALIMLPAVLVGYLIWTWLRRYRGPSKRQLEALLEDVR